MSDRADLTEQDLVIAGLVGRYIERREHDEAPNVDDLLAAAAEFDEAAVDALRTVLACYEAMRLYGADTGSPATDTGNLDGVSAREASPTVEEVLRFEDLPLGSRGSRRAIVRWTDGTEGEALTWYADEILSPVNRVGRR